MAPSERGLQARQGLGSLGLGSFCELAEDGRQGDSGSAEKGQDGDLATDRAMGRGLQSRPGGRVGEQGSIEGARGGPGFVRAPGRHQGLGLFSICPGLGTARPASQAAGCEARPACRAKGRGLDEVIGRKPPVRTLEEVPHGLVVTSSGWPAGLEALSCGRGEDQKMPIEGSRKGGLRRSSRAPTGPVPLLCLPKDPRPLRGLTGGFAPSPLIQGSRRTVVLLLKEGSG
jgi:hypothetical protein